MRLNTDPLMVYFLETTHEGHKITNTFNGCG
jgi:hypothetical protein